MSDNLNKVEVSILEERYVLKGDESPEYMEMLALQVNKRLRQAQGNNPRLSVTQAAILTALNILDEYSKLQQEYRNLVDLLEDTKGKG
jgi:cell division protein ZapA